MGKGLLFAIFILLAILAVFMISNYKRPVQNVASATPQSTQENKESSITGAVGEVKEITVLASEYEFTPTNIELKEGEAVKLTFKNTGTLPHNLVIDELGVTSKTINGGKEDVVEFKAIKTGSFKFYCSIGNHRSLGMEGKATVK